MCVKNNDIKTDAKYLSPRPSNLTTDQHWNLFKQMAKLSQRFSSSHWQSFSSAIRTRTSEKANEEFLQRAGCHLIFSASPSYKSDLNFAILQLISQRTAGITSWNQY